MMLTSRKPACYFLYSLLSYLLFLKNVGMSRSSVE